MVRSLKNRRQVLALFLVNGFLVNGAVIAGTFAFTPSIARAEVSAPAADVKKVFEDVQNIVKAEKGKSPDDVIDAKLKQVILPLFNFDEMSKRSLGASWNKATAAEQKEFVDLFSDLLARTYLKKIKQNADASVLLQISDTVDGDKATVRSKIKSGDDDIQLDYRMALAEGKWKVYDVIIENVGLVNNYRNEFPGIVRNEGFEGLIKRLKNKQIVSDQKIADAKADAKSRENR